MTYSHRNGETEPPIEPGTYWYETDSGYEMVRIVDMGVEEPYLIVHLFGTLITSEPYRMRRRWYGPIPEPEVTQAPKWEPMDDYEVRELLGDGTGYWYWRALPDNIRLCKRRTEVTE